MIKRPCEGTMRPSSSRLERSTKDRKTRCASNRGSWRSSWLSVRKSSKRWRLTSRARLQGWAMKSPNFNNRSPSTIRTLSSCWKRRNSWRRMWGSLNKKIRFWVMKTNYWKRLKANWRRRTPSRKLTLKSLRNSVELIRRKNDYTFHIFYICFLNC